MYTFTILVALILYTYYKAAITEPTSTSIEKYLSVSNPIGNPIANIDLARYSDCAFCRRKKFERSSHCKKCDKCVLRRDHHCIWIGNCVGYQNNQYFVNFLIWTTVNL